MFTTIFQLIRVVCGGSPEQKKRRMALALALPITWMAASRTTSSTISPGVATTIKATQKRTPMPSMRRSEQSIIPS
ncbi:hypothetical protein IIB79_03750 [candidate division KSB1 bacterium]|nr:hypothetical protein [candidate division KSB1 bacterium]